VILSGDSVRLHGRTNIIGRVGFEVDEPGTYTVASYVGPESVLASSVTITDLPTDRELSFERRGN
jgi:hypothetical protein